MKLSYLKIIIPLVFILALNSCALSRKRPPEVASPNVKNELNKVEIDKAAGAKGKALNRLRAIVKKYPNTDVADDAYMMMGDLYWEGAEYQKAYDAYISVVNAEVFSPREADALMGASRSLYKLGRYDETLALTDKGLKYKGLSKNTKFEFYKLRYKMQSHFGESLGALKSLVFLSLNAPTRSQQEGFKVTANDFVESRLSDKDLERVADDSNFGFVRSYALFRVGQLAFDQRDYRRARRNFEKVLAMDPSSEIAEKSARLIAQIEARREVNPRTVGAILPLSGRHKRVGYRSLRGLQMGLGIYGPSKSGFQLAVIDSESNPDAARKGVERLVMEDHVISVVGSLLSRTSVAVAAKSDELGVPNIALSQKSGLTEIGDYVFRTALTSDSQVNHLVHYAMDRLEIKKFAILYPNDSYGVEYANLFWDHVRARGGEITAVQSYRPKETDFRGPIQRMAGTYYVASREREHRLRLTNWFTEKKTLRSRYEPPDDLLPPVVDFDGIFIPDNTKTLGQISAMLAALDVKDVKLLGTNLWNSKSLVKRGQKLVEGAVFVDGLLASDANFRKSRFFNDFKKTFGYEPGVFEVQAYDAGLILRQIVAGGERSRVGLRDELQRLKGFSGSIGQLATDGQREIVRPLVSLTVHEGQIQRTKAVSKE